MVIHLVMHLLRQVGLVDLPVVEDLQVMLLIQEEQVILLQLLPLKEKMEEQAVTLVVVLHQVLEVELEQLVEVEVPERAEYLRVIMAELTRLVNHVTLVGFFINDLGALGTPLLYAFREREKILDLFEQASGLV